MPDPNRDKYQLVFTKGYEELKKGQKKLDLEQQWQHYAASFIDELNRVGAQGYRLISIAVSPRLAVLRRSDHQYEYALIPITNRKRRFDSDAEFGPKYLDWARKGFRVADYIVLHDWCAPGPLDDEAPIQPIECTYISHVLLERKKDVNNPHRYEIVYVRPTFSKEKFQTDLAEELDRALKKYLYPTHMLTKFQLLMQSSFDTEDFVGDENEMEIVTGDVRKNVNALARQGYRLRFRPLAYDAAIMFRRKGTTTPATYIWVSENKVEQELPRFQQQGIVYRMNYGCASGTGHKFQLIFEQPSVTDGKQREYKVVAIELKQLKNAANGRVEFQLSTASNNALQEFKRLTKEGFEARDFFDCHVSDNKERAGRAKILLERTREK